jgi:hypothetical protein
VAQIWPKVLLNSCARAAKESIAVQAKNASMQRPAMVSFDFSPACNP